MKVLRGTLTFILGMILGVILFLAALAGALYGITATVKIGKIEQIVGQQIFDENSIQDQTLFDTGWELYQDIKAGIMTMSINELSTKYGVKTKLDPYKEVKGIDLSPLFSHPLNDLSAAVDEVIKSITLNDVGELAGIDFASYNLPVLNDNLYVGVTTAFDNILKSINGDITLRAIEDNFGISLGENELFDEIKDAPLSSFGDLVNAIEIGTLLDTDEDLFVVNGANNVYVKTAKYEEVAPADFYSIKDGAKTYAAKVSDGKIARKELRFVAKQVVGEDGELHTVVDEDGNTVFVVDNSSNKDGFEYDGETKYYRFMEYEPYKLGQTYPSGTEFAVRAYSNHFDTTATGNIKLIQKGYVALSDIYTDSALSTPLKATAKTITINNTCFYEYDGAGVQAEVYDFNPEIYLDKDSKVEKGFKGYYLLIHKGSADMPIQSIANLTITGLNNATSSLLNVKLSDLINIDESSASVVQALKNTTLNDISAAVDNLVLGDIVTIQQSAYVKSTTGNFVYIESNSVYRPYNKELDTGETRYKAIYAPAANGKYVCISGTYYVYDADNPAMAGLERYDIINYVVDNELGKFVKSKQCGYYTAYNPAIHRADNVLSEGGNIIFFKIYTDDENNTFAEATKKQIAANVGLYCYNEVTEKMVACDNTTKGTLYVKQAPSSKALQRLQNVRLPSCADEFKNLVLGDVFEIDGDEYSVATASFSVASDTTDESITYFIYNMGIYEAVDRAYISANPYQIYYVFNGTGRYYYYDGGVYFEATPEYIGAHPDGVYYVSSKQGTAHIMLKKMMFLKIDDLGTKMTAIINDLYLKDLIDINEFDIVKTSEIDDDNANARWIVEYNPALDETVDGKTYHYVYTYDSNGKYYVKDTDYKPMSTSDLTEGSTFFYGYQQLYSGSVYTDAMIALASHATNLYFKDSSGKYHYNIAYCTYLFNKGDYSNVYYRQIGTGSYTGKTYSYDGSTANLYVNILGTYIAYNPSSNPEHLDLDIYLKETGGTYFVRLDADFNYMKEHGTAPVTYSKQLCYNVLG
ncbi:MAG: hypothetical protein MJ193_01010 [Clostridia bacterium]|nr:hypothetical protein [Clostridia bacterium]